VNILGKYSIALEKAKDDSARQNEPRVEQVMDEVKEVTQPEEGVVNLQASAPLPEKTSSPVAEQTDLAEELAGWDEKLRDIIAGNSKHVAESMRMLRTKIFYPESGEPPRTILVTSAIPGEGKSFVCANLGVSIALGISTEALIVECDLRRPSLSKLFGLTNSRGLVDYLQSGTPVEQLIQKTSMPNLSVLPSGKLPKNPAELIDSPKMKTLIKKLEDQNPYRLVIFDSPPIQAAAETDVLAKTIEKVLLVVRWGYARREHARQLVEVFGKDKILGVVFNAFEMSQLESNLQGYYYGYKDYSTSSYTRYYKEQPKKKWGRRRSS
jgi:capsular exopolysaccharide synthesis family protein